MSYFLGCSFFVAIQFDYYEATAEICCFKRFLILLILIVIINWKRLKEHHQLTQKLYFCYALLIFSTNSGIHCLPTDILGLFLGHLVIIALNFC